MQIVLISRTKLRRIIVILSLLPCFICALAKEVINPMSYGVLTAKNNVERYKILYRCHSDAVKSNAAISYAGINTLDIDIPADAQSIPLPAEVDFAGVHINVFNNQKNIFLFTRLVFSKNIEVSPTSIDNGDFRNIPNLNTGRNLLIVEDNIPWVEKRKGYDFAAIRKDLLIIENGIAINSVINSYNNNNSAPKTIYVEVQTNEEYKNIVFNRDSKSTKITYLFSLNNLYGLNLSNIIINTPQDNNLSGDYAIQLKNCAKVCLNEICINGTYSQNGIYGYGIDLENVAMFTGNHISARSRWGVFCTNNVNGATLKDCDINRFDIHCYGKDVNCYNCRFSDLYNQFSSAFGNIYFENCTFTNFTPVLLESSYNAYSPFNLVFQSCVINLTSKKNCLVNLSGLEADHNSRPELYRKSLPNITIRDCSVNLTDDVKAWYIINTGSVRYKETLDYINKIEVNRLKINGNVDYKLFSTEIKTTKPLKVVRKRVTMNSR